MSSLLAYLELVASFKLGPEDFKYRSYEGLVLAEGRYWIEARVENHGPYKECYNNAFYAATKNNWQYVEGYATSIIPVGHAWCLDGDDIVETTWDTPGDEYWGIVFPLDYVSEITLETGRWGILGSDYLNNFTLLKKGMTSNHQPT